MVPKGTRCVSSETSAQYRAPGSAPQEAKGHLPSPNQGGVPLQRQSSRFAPQQSWLLIVSLGE